MRRRSFFKAIASLPVLAVVPAGGPTKRDQLLATEYADYEAKMKQVAGRVERHARRLIHADDIAIDYIRAVDIRADTITADKIDTLTYTDSQNTPPSDLAQLGDGKRKSGGVSYLP